VTRAIPATLSVTLFFAGAWSLGVLHGSAALPPQLLHGIELNRPATPPIDGTADTAWPHRPAPVAGEPADTGHRDLYGNDVSDAVATYSRDRAGSVYEEHSPQTEVPRLAPPTT
jgi:hypothetical protein